MEGAGPGPLIVVEVAQPIEANRPSCLADVGGTTSLELTLRRLAPLATQAGAATVVATTDRAVDDPIADLVRDRGTPVVRGPSDDRVRTLAMAHVRDARPVLVRLPSPGPFADPFVVVAALDLHRSQAADLTSNLIPRSYPRGLDVEVLSARALRSAELEATFDERSDPTSFVRQRPERFRLASLLSGHDLAAEDWSLADADALERVRAMASHTTDLETTSWSRLLAIAGRTVRPRRGEVVLQPIAGSEPGAAPWVRRWAAVVDGDPKGTVEVITGSGGTERRVAVPEPWLEAARAALHRRLLAEP